MYHYFSTADSVHTVANNYVINHFINNRFPFHSKDFLTKSHSP